MATKNMNPELTEARKLELVELLTSIPTCTCVYESNNNFLTKRRRTNIEDCPGCVAMAPIHAEVYGESPDYQMAQLWKRQQAAAQQ